MECGGEGNSEANQSRQQRMSPTTSRLSRALGNWARIFASRKVQEDYRFFVFQWNATIVLAG